MAKKTETKQKNVKSRGNGDGSIYFNESRKCWIAQATVGRTADGKPKRKAVYGKTKKEVKDKLDAIRNELKTGLYVEPSKITISVFLLHLIDDDKAMNIIGDDTYLRKIGTYNRIKASPIADVPLQAIQEYQIRDFLHTITDFSDSVIRKDFELLKRCFREAIHRDIIVKNPMYGMKCPKSTQKQEKTRALTLAEQKRLLEVLTTHDVNYSVQMQLMLLTGLRMGEINALDVDDVNLDFKVLNVRRSLTRNLEEKTVIGKTTKTYAGERKIPLSAPAVALLRQYMKDGYTPNYENLLFWDKKGNKIITTNQVNNQLIRTLKKYKVLDPTVPGKVTLHSLRHTYATRCIEAGMQAKVLQKLLGHTDIKVTMNTYCDAFSEFQEENIEKFEQYLLEKKLS